MTYDYKSKKIVALVADNLEPWQSMNVVGHMAIALGARKDDDLMGREVLVDQSGAAHVGIARFGFIIKKGNAQDISHTVAQAKNMPDLKVIDFPREMLDTHHDDELAISMSLKSDFEYLGVLMYGPMEKVNELTKGFKLWS